MPTFSPVSERRLSTCHPDLQRLFREVVRRRDCMIACGHRGEADQNIAFAEGKSRLKYPASKHNKKPSMAVDCVPWPEAWSSEKACRDFGAFVKGVAKELGIGIVWGGDWIDFVDLPHFELAE